MKKNSAISAKASAAMKNFPYMICFFDENLSKEDIKKIKKVAVDLLDKIK